MCTNGFHRPPRLYFTYFFISTYHDFPGRPSPKWITIKQQSKTSHKCNKITTNICKKLDWTSGRGSPKVSLDSSVLTVLLGCTIDRAWWASEGRAFQRQGVMMTEKALPPPPPETYKWASVNGGIQMRPSPCDRSSLTEVSIKHIYHYQRNGNDVHIDLEHVFLCS